MSSIALLSSVLCTTASSFGRKLGLLVRKEGLNLVAVSSIHRPKDKDFFILTNVARKVAFVNWLEA